MLLEKLQEHKNFTAHEKDVAEYILSHLDQISELSVGELAKASYTSKATVVRLSQKLGLNGFQFFQPKEKLSQMTVFKRRPTELPYSKNRIAEGVSRAGQIADKLLIAANSREEGVNIEQ